MPSEGRPRKDLSKEQILTAMGKTQSNLAASRYLSCSYPHYKKWAKFYDATEEGFTNLFEQHKNQYGVGIPKFLNVTKKNDTIGLLDIIEGRATPHSFKPEKIKHRLIAEGFLAEECSICKMQERRVTDYKMPLLLHFADNDKKNYKLENISLVCYNCYFLTVDNLFTPREIVHIEDYSAEDKHGKEPEWELDEYQLGVLKQLGLIEEPPEEDYISRNK
tara:strand:- start:1029 stop:1685 length:657 start_codon:yes stop_codon:yes gene_type:complete